MTKTALIILAAGSSTRMGTCKFLLEITNGITLLEHQLISALSFLFQKIIIVTTNKNKEEVLNICSKFNTKLIEVKINENPELERLFSLQVGLETLHNFDYCFIQNADNPYLKTNVLQMLFDNKNKANTIIPTYNNKGGHPILIDANTIALLKKAPTSSMINVEINKTNCLLLPINDESILVNIDTKKDYLEFKELLLEKHF